MTWPFEGKHIPHKYGSVVSSSDVHQLAKKKCRSFAVKARQVLSDWEQTWSGFQFNEVFSLFGIPMLQLDPAAEMEAVEVDDILQEPPLTEQELSELRPMRVVARLRPLLPHEGQEVAAEVVDKVAVCYETQHGYVPGKHRLHFDAALSCGQAEFFQSSGVRALIQRACEGYVGSVVAYGQTGAGKTYSLFGPPESLSQLVEDELSDEAQELLPLACHGLVDEARRAKTAKQGLLPRALQFLFRTLKAMNYQGSLKASFMEIYNETVYDLFNPQAARLDVFQRPGAVGFHVPGLTTIACGTAIELMQALQKGLGCRHSQGHALSRDSSRAHAIFCVPRPNFTPAFSLFWKGNTIEYHTFHAKSVSFKVQNQ